MSKTKSLQRTKAVIESGGYACGIVERYIHFTAGKLDGDGYTFGVTERFFQNRKIPPGIKSDLFGCFDLVALSIEEGIIGIQCCGEDFAEHYRKLTVDKADILFTWLMSGGKCELWGWRQLKENGELVWTPRIALISLEDLSIDQEKIKERV